MPCEGRSLSATNTPGTRVVPGVSCSSGRVGSGRVTAGKSRVYPGSFTSSDTISDTDTAPCPRVSREVPTTWPMACCRCGGTALVAPLDPATSLARLGRREPPERVHRLIRVPDRHQLPPAAPVGHRHVLRGATAPVGDVQGLRRSPPVRPEMLGPEPHRGDLAATGPAGPGRAGSAAGVEPDGRGSSGPGRLRVAPATFQLPC
jgi:hypothetical protein